MLISKALNLKVEDSSFVCILFCKIKMGHALGLAAVKSRVSMKQFVSMMRGRFRVIVCSQWIRHR